MTAHQAPPSLGFSRQEHWSALPFPSPMQESEKWKWSRSVRSDSGTPWTTAYQVPPSMGFSRQEYWSGVSLPSPTSNPTTHQSEFSKMTTWCSPLLKSFLFKGSETIALRVKWIKSILLFNIDFKAVNHIRPAHFLAFALYDSCCSHMIPTVGSRPTIWLHGSGHSSFPQTCTLTASISALTRWARSTSWIHLGAPVVW